MAWTVSSSNRIGDGTSEGTVQIFTGSDISRNVFIMSW